MDVNKIDKNIDGKKAALDDLEYHRLPGPAFDLYGVYFDGKYFVRMPEEIAEKVSAGVKVLYKIPSGGRVRFATDSNLISLRVKYDGLFHMISMPLISSCGFTLTEDSETGSRFVTVFKPTLDAEKGFTASYGFREKKMRYFTLFFPVYNEISELEIGMEPDCRLAEGKRYNNSLPLLYYGSSITQGCLCSRADNTYPAFISKRNNFDFINLGFSGNAKAEDFMVDYLASVECSVFICDYDYNAADAAYLEKTHYRLYERYRSRRKEGSIIFISRPNCYGENNERERRQIIRRTYLRALKSGDKQVYFIDGSLLWGREVHACTVDGCHPNDLGFFMMAKKIEKVIKKVMALKNLQTREMKSQGIMG